MKAAKVLSSFLTTMMLMPTFALARLPSKSVPHTRVHHHSGAGFYTNAPPKALSSAWQNTYGFYSHHGKGIYAGSFFPVAKFKSQTQNLVLFMTAAHNLRVANNLSLDPGDELILSRDLQVDIAKRKPSFRTALKFTLMKSASDLGSDTAAFVLAVNEKDFAQIHPLKFSDEMVNPGIRSYVLGFPNFAARPSLKKNSLVKAWSKGITLEQTGYSASEVGDDRLPLLTSTADTLPGDSGGPVVNEKGQVIGMLIGGLSPAQYTGSEVPFKENPYSFIVPATYAKILAGQLWYELTREDL